MFFKTDRGMINLMQVVSIEPFCHEKTWSDGKDVFEITFFTIGSKHIKNYKTKEEYEKDVAFLESFCINLQDNPLKDIEEEFMKEVDSIGPVS